MTPHFSRQIHFLEQNRDICSSIRRRSHRFTRLLQNQLQKDLQRVLKLVKGTPNSPSKGVGGLHHRSLGVCFVWDTVLKGLLCWSGSLPHSSAYKNHSNILASNTFFAEVRDGTTRLVWHPFFILKPGARFFGVLGFCFFSFFGAKLSFFFAPRRNTFSSKGAMGSPSENPEISTKRDV